MDHRKPGKWAQAWTVSDPECCGECGRLRARVAQYEYELRKAQAMIRSVQKTVDAERRLSGKLKEQLLVAVRANEANRRAKSALLMDPLGYVHRKPPLFVEVVDVPDEPVLTLGDATEDGLRVDLKKVVQGIQVAPLNMALNPNSFTANNVLTRGS